MFTFRTLFVLALVVALGLGVTEQSYAKVYASYVRVTQEGSALPFDGSFADRTGATIRFRLNHSADSVVINVVPAGGGASLKRLWAGASVAGDNSINWDGSQDNGTPTPVGAYKLEITAYHGGYGSYTEYHLSTPAIFTRGVGSVNNPALRYFGFIYTASNGGYVTGVGRHASDGSLYGDSAGAPRLTTTGVPVGPSELRYATTVDNDGYVYIIGRTARRIYRYHLDTLNVALFDSSVYGTRIQGLDVRGSGAGKILYVAGDTAVFSIPIGTQSFNTIPPTPIAYAAPTVNGRVMNFWDVKVGQDNSLYANYRVDSAAARFGRGLFKWDLASGSLPKTIADTVWSSPIPDGDPVTLALWDGATTASSDDILYMNTDLAVPNTFPSAIYAYTDLGTPTPTRSVAWLDPDNNCSVTRSALAVDVLGNIIYFENSNEQVVLVSPPSGPNSYTYTAFDQVTITAAGVTPPLLSIALAREDLDGNRQPDRLGDTVKVIGVINSTNVQTTNFGYFMQDATGGIHLFQFGLVGAPTLRPGYRVEVVGVIAYFRGTTEISPANLATDITILDTGNVLTPIPLTIGQYKADPETYESRLIQFNVAHPLDFTSAQWPAAGSSANLNIWNGIDTTTLRIDSDTEVDGSPYPAFPVRLNAIATQFTSSTTTHNNGYQVTPFFVADFFPINYPPLPTFRLLTPVNGSQLEIDSAASYDFTWRRAVDFNNDALIYQYKPVAFAGSLSNNAGADTVKTLTGAQLLTYLGTADSLVFRWTVLAKDTPNPPVSTTDTFAVTIRRSLPPPPAGWTNQTSGVTAVLQSTKQVNSSVAWAAGNGGVVLRTTNGGNTWSSVGGGAMGTLDLYAIDAISATTAFTTASPATGSYLFRTTNAGTSWDTVFFQSGGFLNAIHMFDATNGIAVGDPVGTWTVLRTSNGGASWARIATEPAQVGSEFGANNGLAVVGNNHIWFSPGTATGRVYRSTDGGATWASSVLPFLQFTSGLAFSNTQYGVAGGSGGAAARTTDGGVTWTSVTLPASGTVYGIAATNAEFFATRGAAIYRSTDRGATWASSYAGGVGALNHISAASAGANAYLKAVSGTGGITSGYFVVTGVDDQPEELPGSFTLMQNYPNPFNPSTTIRYALPKDAFVTLKVYNLLGQEVASLRDEMQNVGFHDVVWNGRNNAGQTIASGVYFYRLEARPADGAEPFTSFKKMLMLK